MNASQDIALFSNGIDVLFQDIEIVLQGRVVVLCTTVLVELLPDNYSRFLHFSTLINFIEFVMF